MASFEIMSKHPILGLIRVKLVTSLRNVINELILRYLLVISIDMTEFIGAIQSRNPK